MKHAFFKALMLVLMFACGISWADPPGRVGRISYTQGQVSFRNAYGEEAATASQNWPVTSPNVIATGSQARAEVRVGSTALGLGSDSELEVAQLDDNHFTLHLARGSVIVRIKSSEQVRDFALSTPQGWVTLSEPSRIRVDAERAPDTTALSVSSGMARFDGAGSSVAVHAGTRAEIAGGAVRMTDARPYEDELDAWSLARDQGDDRVAALRYVSPETTGYEDLDANGAWLTSESYGAVWYPTTVSSDWAPYRYGRWTWVAPWGWTWVDNAPWGYAPFHYGRWVWFHHRWCWAPGRFVAHPVWAPALVGWVGGANWSLAFSSGTAPAVGWFPLAPHEVFVPSYPVSSGYLQQVNVTHVTDITNVTVVNGVASVPPPHFRNRSSPNAVTVVPQDHFRRGRSVVVATAPKAVINQPQHLQSAPVSASVPVAIAGLGPRGRTEATAPNPPMRRDQSTVPAPGVTQQATPSRPSPQQSMPPQRTPMVTGAQPRTNEPGAIRQPNRLTESQTAQPVPSAPSQAVPSRGAAPNRPPASTSTPAPATADRHDHAPAASAPVLTAPSRVVPERQNGPAWTPRSPVANDARVPQQAAPQQAAPQHQAVPPRAEPRGG